ncbi:4Fe-4S dicluster domain-containing protein [Anaerosacchariphilus polymeriproducens]|uniref:4Fe-4S dicluster domain-containing protein n=1 Tax=Anaerosacchariphilus polymeriproducens TaxID=1812858 RepID=A0A371AXG3_9FIRM|nr:4Fe-4S dicluster domain-containing protein [Anaerosacchariphilus polymeriproducens]RDU24263.1 4Fe-4S dicluster domain-containing protein [Anaerosacchariphilus polymeriproducens]
MRGLETQVSRLRRKVFEEVARVAFDSENIHSDIQAIPFKIIQNEIPKFRESIYHEREIISERVRLTMGMSLRPEDKPVHLTSGLEESNIAEKYYEPPLIQVIPSACNACESKKYEVSNQCKGCVARPCMEVCPKHAVSRVDGKAYIDQEKCIKCGKCKAVCPYDAIAKKTRPCEIACGVNAIEDDAMGRAQINSDKCVSCGMCLVSCPFGAIADKSQIFQLIRAMQTGVEIIAEVAPAYVGQFGRSVTPGRIKAALMELGFSDVIEVALGADIGAVAEAHHYVEEVATGKLPFLLTSCCPSWSVLAKKYFPEIVDNVSTELTPMVATARSIKKEKPEAKVVFIGPCPAKKLEASRRTVRSDVDFVITFEELAGIFAAKGIDLEHVEEKESMHDATGVGRAYAVAGGVTDAIKKCIDTYYPEVEVKTEHAEGLHECKKLLALAKTGKLDGYMLEGMGCPGGCVAGAGTMLPINQAKAEVKKIVEDTAIKVPPIELKEIELS